jgi:hypothetical protein
MASEGKLNSTLGNCRCHFGSIVLKYKYSFGVLETELLWRKPEEGRTLHNEDPNLFTSLYIIDTIPIPFNTLVY